MTPFQFMFFRSIFCVLLILAFTHVNTKKVLWDDIDGRDVPALAFRCFQGSLTVVINYMVSAVLPLAIVGVVGGGLTPPCIMLCAWCILKEKVKKDNIVWLAIVVVISIGIVFGAYAGGNNSEEQAISISEAPILYTLLFMTPLLTAGGTVAIRRLRSFNIWIISYYLNWTLLFTTLAIIAIARGKQALSLIHI